MKLPFRVNRCLPKTLTLQIVDGFKAAIGAGRLKEGDVLPSRSSLSNELQVSECVVRRALAKLAADGILVGRPRIGYKVVRQKTYARPTSILFINSGHFGSFAACAYEQALRRTLSKSGYQSLSLYLASGEKTDYEILKRVLAERPDFAVVCVPPPHQRIVTRLVAQANVQHDILWSRTGKAGGGFNPVRDHDFGPAVADFVADCVRKGVRSVWQCDYGKATLMNAVPALHRAGISAERVSLVPVPSDSLESLQQGAMRRMVRLLDAAPLPDLVFFTDDYLTMAAMSVLLERGIGIPNDVRVVTLANRGFGPVFTKSFARIEVDPYQCGVDDGNRLLAWMRTGKPQSRASTAIYIPGDTFPPHSYATKGTTP